jgi:hypothetical protein
MTTNLYFGGTNSELANTAQAVDPQAFLIDHSNYIEFLNSPPDNATVYTSLGDLPKISKDTFVIYQLLDLADKIYYVPTDSWKHKEDQIYVESILFSIKQQKNNVYNLDLTKYSAISYTKLVDSRQTNQPQLWISGCSISDGVGVDTNQRYGQLIADRLKLPVSFLTKGGSSIPWAVDQIVRSDVCSGDIVILGLTEEFRFPYWATNNEVWHISSGNQQKHLMSFTNLSTNIIDRLITDDNCFYQSITSIHQLVNFCNKINAKLLILGLLSSNRLALYLNNLQNFIHYKNFKSPIYSVDLGTDHRHPGPLQHQLYADFCQTTLKKLNYI